MTTVLVRGEAFEAEEVEIRGERYRHLFRARRLQVGESVRIVDGEGRARWGTVERVDRSAGILRCGGPAPDNESPLDLMLAVGAPRPERASWLVEKTTEVGVRTIVWLRCRRSPRTYGTAALARQRRVAEAAVEQCGRSRVPAIDGMWSFEDLAGRLGERTPFVLDPAGERLPDGGEPDVAGLLVVGPEGGLTAEEKGTLSELGARAIGLGARTLRVETAAVLGSALLLGRSE